MACALPVVVCEDAGVAEILEDGVTACFTKPRDEDSVVAALKLLIDDGTLRKGWGLRPKRCSIRDSVGWTSSSAIRA